MPLQLKISSKSILPPNFLLSNNGRLKTRQLLQQHSYQALNTHYCQHLFSCTAQNDSDNTLLHALYKPEQRLQILQNLPLQLQHLHYLSIRRLSNADLFEKLQFNDNFKKHLLMLANAGNLIPQAKVMDISYLLEMLSPQQFQCLLRATSIYQLFFQHENTAHSSLFFLNLEHAYACMQLAENLVDPLAIYTSVLVRSISLISIQTLLDQQDSASAPAITAQSIAQLLPKLDYWFAKDLGLNENIQGNLRGKFLLDKRSLGSQILRDGEYQHTAKQLYRLNRISLNDLNFLLARRKQRQLQPQ